jgi:hypothetical protein
VGTLNAFILPHERLQAPHKVRMSLSYHSVYNINHEALLQKLKTYPALKRVIGAWLKAGYVDNGVFEETPSGTPQGGVGALRSA